MPKKGFTLVELLVVVAMIGMLVAIALPALSKSKASARTIECRNNVRQLILATLNYVGENGTYPLYSDPWGGRWNGALQLYLATASNPERFVPPFHCRASENGDRFLDALPNYGYNDSGIDSLRLSGISYGLGGVWVSTNEVHACKESTVVNSADMIALGDGIYAGPYSSNGAVGISDSFSPDVKKGQVSFPKEIQKRAEFNENRRHNGRYNVAFCDGHAILITKETLFSSVEPARRRWNTDNTSH